MNLGSDPADQVVRYTLEGTEYALRLSGVAAKNFAIFAAAVLRDQKKTHGKTRLIRLLREGKPLKFFSVSTGRMREFTQEAKRHGLLFVPMRDRSDPEHIEIAIWADDAAKVERIIERMQLDVVQTGEAEILSEVDREVPAPAQNTVKAGHGPDAPGFTRPAPPFTEPEMPPSRSTRTNVPPSVRRYASRSSSPNISPALHAGPVRTERPSVRDELREIKTMLHPKEPVIPAPKMPIRIHRGDRTR